MEGRKLKKNFKEEKLQNILEKMCKLVVCKY